jgi:D-glycero-D-manno-heptose 1,7-bisphosphate phosphatase
VGVGSIEPLRPAVFFDRDGVLNRAVVRDGLPYPPRTQSEVSLEDDVEAGLMRLASVIPLIFVVSNQPDVARGTLARAFVEEVNALLTAKLPITRFYTCYHDDAEGCSCRKPAPGLFQEAANNFGVDLAASFMVGDRWRDVDAGFAAGCTTILIQKGYSERPPLHAPDAVVQTVSEAVDFILSRYTSKATSSSIGVMQ